MTAAIVAPDSKLVMRQAKSPEFFTLPQEEHSMMKKALFTALILVAGFTTAKADPSGSLSFADISGGAADTGNINTANTLTIGDLFSTTGLGVFAGIPNQIFGAVSFTPSSAGSLSFGNAVFGTFTSTSIEEFNSSTPGSVSFYVLGDYTPGTYVGGSGPDLASFTVSFNQTPAGSGSISDSASFSVPPTGDPVVPEPSSIVMALTAVAAVTGLGIRRHRQSARAAA